MLDTSVILNLLAAGPSESIIQALDRGCFVCTAAADETIYIRGPEPDYRPHLVSVDSWLDTKTVILVSPKGPKEEELYVRFAAELDDGESMSLAICCSRGYALATDDRKARRLARSLAPTPVELVSTAEIIHSWAHLTGVESAFLRRTILSVEARARFRPSSSDPHHDWWLAALMGS